MDSGIKNAKADGVDMALGVADKFTGALADATTSVREAFAMLSGIDTTSAGEKAKEAGAVVGDGLKTLGLAIAVVGGSYVIYRVTSSKSV